MAKPLVMARSTVKLSPAYTLPLTVENCQTERKPRLHDKPRGVLADINCN